MQTGLSRTNDLYNSCREQLGVNDFGFKILYGPPRIKPPVLFIGDQPGGRVADEKPDERSSWPLRCEYATEGWTLARNMQTMFSPSFLADCVGVNANFFRSPNATSWSAVRAGVREVLETFCTKKLLTLISLMIPKLIVTIGLSVLGKFGPCDPSLFGKEQRILMRRGRIARWPAVSTLHLSGAQISREDRLSIANAVLGLTQNAVNSITDHEISATLHRPILSAVTFQNADGGTELEIDEKFKMSRTLLEREGPGVTKDVETGDIGPNETYGIISKLVQCGLTDKIYGEVLHHSGRSIDEMRRYASNNPDRRYKVGNRNFWLHQKLEWMWRVCQEQRSSCVAACDIATLAEETRKEGWAPELAA